MRQALNGITVIELAEGVAGTYCGKLFADLGATVVKVEPPTGGRLRHQPSTRHGPDGHFRGGALLHLNTNKRSIVVDAHDTAGRAKLRQLLERAHLVIEESGGDDPASGLLESFEIRWDELHEQYPALCAVHISGFGLTGPYAGYRWADIVVQAVSGALLLQGRSDQDPLRLPGQLGLCFVGNTAALGALAAVVLAERTGEGSLVDVAAVEAMATIPMRQATLLAYSYRGGRADQQGLVASSDTLIPTGVYPCADGYMALMSTPQQLKEMLDVLDNDDLRAAFARPDAFERPETKEAVDLALYPWLLSHTRAEATAAAQKAGWPLAGVNSPAESLAADHLHQRGFWVHTDDPAAGTIDLPGPPYRFAEGGWALRRLSPSLGEGNPEIDEVLNAPSAQVGTSEPAPLRHLGAGPLPRRLGPNTLPLEGIRVLDLTTVWSGPYATMFLADLGAEVIRVENPWVLPPTTKGYTARPTTTNLGFLGSMYGEAAPGRPDRPWNRHAMNNSLARNKFSVSIDTRRPEGKELLFALAERCDVFIENFKATGLDHMGIYTNELQARNPRLVIVRMPPAGLSGEWSGYTGFGAQFDGLTGMLWLCGHRGTDLTQAQATTYMDAASGPGAAFAVLAALRYRAATGRGQLVEFPQSENILNHLGDVFVDLQLGIEPERFGNRDRFRAPQGLYRCQGEHRWLAISVGTDSQWQALAAAIGRPELASDPRFVDAASRHANHDEVDKLIEEWTTRQPLLEAFHMLQRAGVPAGPLLDDEGFVNDPHLKARAWLQPLESFDVGTHLHAGLAFKGVPQAWWRGSPTLGEDNEYVYKEILGVSDEELARYAAEKILATDYLDPTGVPY